MKKYSCYLLLAALFAMAAGCEQKEDLGLADGRRDQVMITVTDAGMDVAGETRAVTDETFTTTFEAGDQIGLFAMKDGSVWEEWNNVPVTYTETGAWDLGGRELLYGTEQTGVTYYAYYPYEEGKTFSSGSMESFFSSLASDWMPAADQSDAEKFAAADLMVASEGVEAFQNKSGQFTISLSMKHVMAMAVMVLPETEYKFTAEELNATPYVLRESTSVFYHTAAEEGNIIKPFLSDDGSYRFIIKPSKEKKLLVTQGADASKKYEFATTVSEGKYQRFLLGGGKKVVEHNLQVGDFYCADGTIVSADAENVPDNCVGVVFFVGNPQPSVLYAGEDGYDEEHDALRRDHPSCVHGLVYAINTLEDVNGRFCGNSKTDYTNEYIIAYLSDHLWLPLSKAEMAEGYGTVLGYNNTQIWEMLNDDISTGDDMDVIRSLKTWRENTPVADVNSGWYLPSAKELSLIYENGTTLDTSLSKVGGNSLWQNIMGVADAKNRYWASSDTGSQTIASISVSDGFVVNRGARKNDSGYWRYALAF